MSTSREVTVKAQNGTMTLGELKAFAAELDHAGAVNTTPISATVRLSGWIKTLKATATRFGDPVESHHGA